MICSGVMVSIPTCHARGSGFYSRVWQVSFSKEIDLEINFFGKRDLLLQGLEPRTSCTAGWNANHYTRTDLINDKEIFII